MPYGQFVSELEYKAKAHKRYRGWGEFNEGKTTGFKGCFVEEVASE